MTPARYAPEAKRAHDEGRGGLVHFDIEPSQIGRVIKPTVAVVGDSKLAMQKLIPMVEYQERADWIRRCNELKTSFPFSHTPASDGRIKTQQAIEAIYKALAPQENKVRRAAQCHVEAAVV